MNIHLWLNIDIHSPGKQAVLIFFIASIRGRQDSLSFYFTLKHLGTDHFGSDSRTEASVCLFSYPGYCINIRSLSIRENVGPISTITDFFIKTICVTILV